MSTKKNFPLPVENLRVIWDKKRIEMRFTQVEAAKILGLVARCDIALPQRSN